MRHVWLALVMLLALIGTADAKPIASPDSVMASVPEHEVAAYDGPLAPLVRDYLQRDQHRRCGMIYVAWAFFYVVGLMAWLAFLAGRDAIPRRYPEQPVTRLVGEGVTTRVLRWHVVWSAMLLVGVVGLWSAGSAVSVMIAPLTVAELIRLARARRIARMLEHPDAIASRRARWLFVQTPAGVRKLRASRSDFVQAARARIPSALVRR